MRDISLDIKRGNVKVFKEFFETYYPVLCVFAQKYILDSEKCKDIVQEALLSYWQKKDDFDNIHKVKGFLYVFVRNRALNHIRDQKIFKNCKLESDISCDSFFEEELLRQETFLIVRRAVESLPERMRLTVQLTMNGLKNSEIANEISIAEGTVHSLKKKAYAKLRIILKENFYLVWFI
ncbi:MAG: sigma-70 family RNA polymerase sigma factor [Bacteroidales bacterium]|nr:sigma-70 family RNA polymerase sigma factor [Bacteroidales bacterium]MDD3990305.1 sigma-70 family RNA polymerase sigma factor [Bacteroidales bacterium]